MANDFYTIADRVADALDLSPAEVSDLREEAPFITSLPALESSNGDTHKYPKYTQSPVTGFRAENVGRDFDHSVDTIVTETLKILDFSWGVDKAVADAWRMGGAQAYVAREGGRHLGSALFNYEKQMIQGTNNDAGGFVGFEDDTALDALADTMVLGNGGSSANSSVYLIRVGENDVAGVMIGGDGGFNLGETIVQNFVDGSSLNLPIYYTPACTWVGKQIGGVYSIARLANFDAGSNTVDDAAIFAGLELFPAGKPPNRILMNKRSQEQLRGSRTATNATGAPAPIPQDVAGIPIMTTDAITSAETTVA